MTAPDRLDRSEHRQLRPGRRHRRHRPAAACSSAVARRRSSPVAPARCRPSTEAAAWVSTQPRVVCAKAATRPPLASQVDRHPVAAQRVVAGHADGGSRQPAVTVAGLGLGQDGVVVELCGHGAFLAQAGDRALEAGQQGVDVGRVVVGGEARPRRRRQVEARPSAAGRNDARRAGRRRPRRAAGRHRAGGRRRR